jgi:hypothetical protein
LHECYYNNCQYLLDERERNESETKLPQYTCIIQQTIHAGQQARYTGTNKRTQWLIYIRPVKYALKGFGDMNTLLNVLPVPFPSIINAYPIPINQQRKL